MNSKILFLNLRPAHHEGIAALLAAYNLGYDVLLLADNIPDYARNFIIDSRLTDTYNFDASVKAAFELHEKHCINGIVTWGDRDVELVSRIGSKLGLSVTSEISSSFSRNKYKMKEKLTNLSEIVPKYAYAVTQEELIRAVNKVGYPAIVKPTSGSGSKGIFKVENNSDISFVYQNLENITNSNTDPLFKRHGSEYIIEEYLNGDEVSVEGFVYNNKAKIIGITDKLTTDPFYIEYQHIFPSRFSSGKYEVREKTKKVVRELGFNNCGFHVEGKITDEGFRVLEAAARLGGGYITSHLIPLSACISVHEDMLRIAIGEYQDLNNKPQRLMFSGIRFILADTEGTITKINGINEALSIPEVEHIFIDMPIGSKTKLPPDSYTEQRALAIIARHRDYDALSKILQRVGTIISLTIE